MAKRRDDCGSYGDVDAGLKKPPGLDETFTRRHQPSNAELAPLSPIGDGKVFIHMGPEHGANPAPPRSC